MLQKKDRVEHDDLMSGIEAMPKHQIQNLRRTPDLLLPRLVAGQVNAARIPAITERASSPRQFNGR
jgi:hypothetical protein